MFEAIKKCSVTMTFYDEFSNVTSIDKDYDFKGCRGEDEAVQILVQVEAFLRANEFKRVMDDYDVELVEKW